MIVFECKMFTQRKFISFVVKKSSFPRKVQKICSVRIFFDSKKIREKVLKVHKIERGSFGNPRQRNGKLLQFIKLREKALTVQESREKDFTGQED